MAKTLSSKLLSVASYVFHFGAAVGFVVYVAWEIKRGRTPQLDVLAAVAAAEFIGVILDKLKEFRDAAELKIIREELTTVQRRIARRQLSEAGKDALEKVLAKYASIRPFNVLVAHGDEEASGLASQLASILNQFGWSGGYCFVIGECSFSGVGITCEANEPELTCEIIRDVSCVLEADGIKTAKSWHRITQRPIGNGMIEINVGKRPPL